MNDTISIDTLLKERDRILAERSRIMIELGTQIESLEGAIQILSGKSFEETKSEYRYDDESKSYIKGTEDGV